MPLIWFVACTIDLYEKSMIINKFVTICVLNLLQQNLTECIIKFNDY